MSYADTSQAACPLFQLPRELRDEIYACYVMEEDGCHHHIETGKISLEKRQPMGLRLMYTCRAIAQDMRGVAISTNKVIFRTGDIEDDEGFRGLHSRAGRFKQILDIVARQRLLILNRVLPLVTPEILEQVTKRFGRDGTNIRDAVASLRTRKCVPGRLHSCGSLYQRIRMFNWNDTSGSRACSTVYPPAHIQASKFWTTCFCGM